MWSEIFKCNLHCKSRYDGDFLIIYIVSKKITNSLSDVWTVKCLARILPGSGSNVTTVIKNGQMLVTVLKNLKEWQDIWLRDVWKRLGRKLGRGLRFPPGRGSDNCATPPLNCRCGCVHPKLPLSKRFFTPDDWFQICKISRILKTWDPIFKVPNSYWQEDYLCTDQTLYLLNQNKDISQTAQAGSPFMKLILKGQRSFHVGLLLQEDWISLLCLTF